MLLLDKSSMRLLPVSIRNICKIVQAINNADKIILLVEQNANLRQKCWILILNHEDGY